MSGVLTKQRAEMSEKELQDLEDYEFEHGPMRVLTQAVQKNSAVLISLRNNHKLIAHAKAFDRHCNMVLENVKEFWQESSPTDHKKKIHRERFVSKMFLRGDSVIVILKHDAKPKETKSEPEVKETEPEKEEPPKKVAKKTAKKAAKPKAKK